MQSFLSSLFILLISFRSLVMKDSEIESISSCSQKEGKKLSECKNVSTSDDKNFRCCFYKTSYTDKSEISKCLEVSNADFNNIGDFIDELEKEGKEIGLKVESLDCRGKFVVSKILWLIALLV